MPNGVDRHRKRGSRVRVCAWIAKRKWKKRYQHQHTSEYLTNNNPIFLTDCLCYTLNFAESTTPYGSTIAVTFTWLTVNKLHFIEYLTWTLMGHVYVCVVSIFTSIVNQNDGSITIDICARLSVWIFSSSIWISFSFRIQNRHGVDSNHLIEGHAIHFYHV